MGPGLVTTMVQQPMEEPSKKLHPFFVKGPSSNEEASIPSQPVEDPLSARRSIDQTLALEHDLEGGRAKKQKIKDSAALHDSGSRARHGRQEFESLDGTLFVHFTRPPPASQLQPKRTPEAKQQPQDDPDQQIKNLSDAADVLQNSIPTSTTLVDVPAKPKKTLRFNAKTGTLGSPPKTKLNTTSSRIVIIKYGKDSDSRRKLGESITDILGGKWQLPITPSKKRGRPSRKPKQVLGLASEPPKQLDNSPFASRASDTEAKNSDIKKRHSIFTSTPVSPRRSKLTHFDVSRIPQFGFKVNGTKVPGSMHPLWPARGMSHVRGGNIGTISPSTSTKLPQARKSKGQVTTIRPDESVVQVMVRQLDLLSIRQTIYQDSDRFPPVPSVLRLPRIHFESGKRLQRRIADRLNPRYNFDCSDTEIDDFVNLSNSHTIPPAIEALYRSLESNLSAYDRSTCESVSWTHKYAPKTATQVLQAGKEAVLLRNWLEALRVDSVDTGNSTAKPAEAPKRKRRKKKLDDFVVDSEEEEEELDEIPCDEAYWSPAASGQARSVIRGGGLPWKNKGKLPNAVLISGPHGCGKTASVYAIAKELDFQVFEINSGSRRSGKDLLEKVGDMTRNHLVQQHQANKPVDEGLSEDLTSVDIKSGKQGMMTAFFKPKTDTTSNSNKATPTTKPPTLDEKGVASVKNQKQSLILLEEVDILYEEDKQFWATLMGMIAQSKRPFIMTCNEESAIPLQSLNLYGIFRFTSPPMDLAVELCLLIAANEGHELNPNHLQSLYTSRGNDLRSTITELNYWCQIGVGDRKGGLDWFISRWPKGSDLDHDGDVIRVISEDTYGHGLGWFSRDATYLGSQLDVEQELLDQSRDLWNFEMGDWLETMDMSRWAKGVSDVDAPRMARVLQSYDHFCTLLSDADVFSGRTQSESMEVIDATLPSIPNRARDDYVVGRTLLEASPVVFQDSSSAAISTSVKSLARNELLNAMAFTSLTAQSQLQPTDECRATSKLEASFHACTRSMTREDLSLAFDPIAVGPTAKAITFTSLELSVFDNTMKGIILDVAPWIRNIVAFDHKLMTERKKLSSLLSEGGNGKRKRMRTTRSAYSALEGGERKTTRRERYFGDDLVMGLVMKTGGEHWQDALPRQQTETVNESAPETLGSSPRSEESCSS